MASINFFTEKVRFKLTNQKKITHWIQSVIKRESSSLILINYIFCSDKYLAEVSTRYLNHKEYTDIITFDNSQSENQIEGDIFISINRVKENAKEYKVEFETELNRVIIHGVLHLIGYRDKTKKEKKAMREKEDTYLSLRFKAIK